MPVMNGQGTSDRLVVPTKPPNKASGTATEVVEGRSLAKGNMGQQNASRTQSRTHGAPSALGRVREAARRDKKAKFTTLLHHLTIERLEAAFRELSRKAAPGVDGVTWEQYAGNLETNLREQLGVAGRVREADSLRGRNRPVVHPPKVIGS
jgi:hypothetical protein